MRAISGYCGLCSCSQPVITTEDHEKATFGCLDTRELVDPASCQQLHQKSCLPDHRTGLSNMGVGNLSWTY